MKRVARTGRMGIQGCCGGRGACCVVFFYFLFFIFYHATELAVQRGQGVKPGLSIHRQDLCFEEMTWNKDMGAADMTKGKCCPASPSCLVWVQIPTLPGRAKRCSHPSGTTRAGEAGGPCAHRAAPAPSGWGSSKLLEHYFGAIS